MAQLLTEGWLKDIQERLKENNSFLKYAVNHSEFIVNNVVNLPQAGAGVAVEKNRAGAGTITQRTDSNLQYFIDQFTTDPVKVTDLESYQLSYNKRQSLMSGAYDLLADAIAGNALAKWSPSGANVITATGAATAPAMAPSATGLRKAITLTDILNAKRKMDNDNVPANGRVMMLSGDQLFDLMQIAEIRNHAGTGFGNSVMEDGSVGKLFGFTVFQKNSLPVYTTGGSPKTGAAVATDNVAALCWHKDFVANAEGDKKMFLNENVAELYGDVLSAAVWHGASKMRSDNKGIVAIMQGA